MSRSPLLKRSCSHGFTLLEVMIAMAILVVGISAMAALSAAMLTRGRQSKYMSLAGTLASEKLEDLNHWYTPTPNPSQNPIQYAGADYSDPEICVPNFVTGSTEGSLNADTTASISCAGATSEPITYYDDVNIDVTNTASDCDSGSSGCFAETTSTTTAGVTSYSTTYHSPNGTISSAYAPSPQPSTTAPSSMMTFHRRWMIEANPTIAGVTATGVRRITVYVTLLDKSVTPTAVNFQMSMVRP